MAKKDKELDNNVKPEEISKNLLNSLLGGYKDSHYNFIETAPQTNISSGSLILDSYINVKSGSTIRIGGGQAESGKSSQCLLFAANYMKIMPKSKTFLVNSEARLSSELQKRSGLKFVTDSNEWDYGTVFVYHSNIMEASCRTIESLLKSMFEQGEHLCVIIDSIDMMTLKQNMEEKEFGEPTKIAGVQFLTKEIFRRIGHPINRYNALLLITSQYSSSISLDPYSKEPPKLMQGTSANALNHQSDYAIYYRPRYQGDFILEDPDEKPDRIKNKIVGVFATVEIKKSATDVTGTVLKIPIKRGKIGNQIWVSKEVGDMILGYGLAKKEKSTFVFSETVLSQVAEENLSRPKDQKMELKDRIVGLNNFYNYLEENEPICNWFYKKFTDIKNTE